jgi:hypothetical protein
MEKVIFPSYKALDLGCSSGKLTFEMEFLGEIGKFCVEMHDGIERFAQSDNEYIHPDLLTGTQHYSFQVPDEGNYSYAAIFWMLAFANFINQHSSSDTD